MEELTQATIIKALRHFKKVAWSKTKKGYMYIMPSPRKGKQLVIQGNIHPMEVAKMVDAIWQGEAKVSDFSCMKEVKIKIKGKRIKAIYTDTIDYHVFPGG